MPFETIRKMHKNHILMENENPEESEYYESIGRVNLYNLGVITSKEEDAFHNVFNMLPIAILEVKDGKARYVRCNRSYRDFVERFFRVDILEEQKVFQESHIGKGMEFASAVKQCCDSGNSAFFDDRMPDGTVAHSYVRRININPVTKSVAVVVAVLSVSEPDNSETYADIALALAADYYNIFVIDLDTNDFVEYSSRVGREEMSMERHGGDFFESAKRDTMTRIYEEDREPFLALFTKENVLRDIDRQGMFTITYRLIGTGTPMYVNMKVTRIHSGNRIILGISNIDAQVRQEEELEKKLTQAQSQANIDALTGVKNKHAYLEAETLMDRRIADQQQSPFAIVIFDVNDLKKVNDTFGHQIGDKYLCDACKIICDIFKRSPVFRVGGDEFAVIVQGHDYDCIEDHLETMNRYNAEASISGGIVIAWGMSKFEGDECVAAVFERADQKMYENKHILKSGRKR